MKRRDFLRTASIASAWLGASVQLRAADTPSQAAMAASKVPMQEGYAGTSRIYYQLHGKPDGEPLFLGFPYMASYGDIFGAENASVLTNFLDRLTDRYRVLVIDYPSIGKSGTVPPAELTVDRACSDVLSVADAVGFKRFAWWGVSVGAEMGMVLASSSDRVSAFVDCGWPPLGAPYADMVQAVRNNLSDPPPWAMKILRDKAQYAQWITFYESMTRWPEAEQLPRIKCPRLVIFGSEYVGNTGGLTMPFAAKIRERRAELEKLGWRVTEIPGRGADVLLDPITLVPLVRQFLDAVT